MSNLSVRPVQMQQGYYPPRMVPVQVAPLPDLFHALPADQAQFRPRGPVSQYPVQMYTPGPTCAPVCGPMPGYQQPGYQLPTQLIKETKPTTYTQKFAKSLEKVGENAGDQLLGVGGVVAGAAKTAVYTPLGALEAVGRTAIAITGGEVSYDHPSPLHRMGEGIELMGAGTGLVLYATGKQAVAVTETMVYAPLAGLELVAYSAGVVAGSAAWVGKQVSDSFVGTEFKAGYHQVMPSKN